MGPEKKRGHAALTAALATCLLLFTLAGGIYFTGYLQNRIFEERTTQLIEITAQVQVNLSNALDSHWNYLTAAVNLLEAEKPDSEADAVSRIIELERLLNTESYSSMLMLLDSKGNCYDAEGKHGVWSDISQLSSGEERYTFIADSYIHQGNYWAFVQKLEEPLQAGDASFTHVVLLKDVYTLSEYYDSAAYGSRNETYILKSKHRLTMVNTPLNKALGVKNQIFHSNETRSPVAWTWERIMSATCRRSSKSMLSQLSRWEDKSSIFCGETVSAFSAAISLISRCRLASSSSILPLA